MQTPAIVGSWRSAALSWQSAALVAGGVIVVAYLRYRRWLGAQRKRVSADSHVAWTSAGPVEYDRRGPSVAGDRGLAILHSHGGNVGHNGWFMVSHLVAAGHDVLTPDRPGYLGTPLADNGSPQAQADLFVALLDALGIERVAVVAISAGGPAALQLALRHPHRVDALVLMSAITRRTTLTGDQLDSTLGRLVMSRRFQDPAYFLIHQAMRRMPAVALRDYVRTETTYDAEVGRQHIRQILRTPKQRRQVMALADAIVPASDRFDGVSNDLTVQQALEQLPLHRINVPTLIVHSRFDGDVPYQGASEARDQIPGAELLAVDQFGHMIWWGDPAVTRAIEARVEDFLRAHAAR